MKGCLCVRVCVRARSYKVEQIAHYHVGETVTSVFKTSLSPGGAEAVIYSTIGGSIGALQVCVCVCVCVRVRVCM